MCEDCGYQRSSDQDGRQFEEVCVQCNQPIDACDGHDIDDYFLVCDYCARIR